MVTNTRTPRRRGGGGCARVWASGLAACLLLATIGPGLAQQSERAYVPGQEELSRCPLTNPEGIVEVARTYPNPQIHVTTPEEYSALRERVYASGLDIQFAPPYGCGDKVRQIHFSFTKDRAAAERLAQATRTGGDLPTQSSGTVLQGGVSQGRAVPDNSLGGTATYDAPGYIPPGNGGSPRVYDGQVQGNAPPQRPAPQPAPAVTYYGSGEIPYPRNRNYRMNYSLSFEDRAVPIDGGQPTPVVQVQLHDTALASFNRGLPTIVRFQGFRTARNVYVTTDIWVRPRGAHAPQVEHFKVNDRMTLRAR